MQLITGLSIFLFFQDKATTDEKCAFQEYYANNFYTEFISVNKTYGQLGFSRKGRGRKGWFVYSGHKSSQFLERPLKIIIDAESNPAKTQNSIKKLQQQLARLLHIYEKKV